MLAASLGIFYLMIAQFAQEQPIAVHPVQTSDSNWQLYKSLFLSPDGRITDTGNGNISHSEGQGLGMLFAVKNNEPETFKLIWEWTQNNLQVRNDPLFAWCWHATKDKDPISDLNNATDGDLYIAWALMRAGRQWNIKKYTKEAKKIVRYTRKSMIREYADLTVLLPGKHGFEKNDHLLLNLSYWIFPALKEFNQIDPDPAWSKLHESGLALIDKTQFGKWQLPPDWISLSQTGEVKISDEFPPRFSYDAIRVPLSLFWAEVSNKKILQPYRNLSEYFATLETPPAWINLMDGSLAPYQASDGFAGIIALANAAETEVTHKKVKPRVSSKQDYYSASLVMLTRQAIDETHR